MHRLEHSTMRFHGHSVFYFEGLACIQFILITCEKDAHQPSTVAMCSVRTSGPFKFSSFEQTADVNGESGKKIISEHPTRNYNVLYTKIVSCIGCVLDTVYSMNKTETQLIPCTIWLRILFITVSV